MKKIVCEELYLFVKCQTSLSNLSSFRHNFDIYLLIINSKLLSSLAKSVLVQNQNIHKNTAVTLFAYTRAYGWLEIHSSSGNCINVGIVRLEPR